MLPIVNPMVGTPAQQFPHEPRATVNRSVMEWRGG